VIMLLTGFSQFLKYKNTNSAKFFIRALVYLLVSAVISGVIIYATGVYHLHFVYGTLLFAAVYSVMSNGKVLVDAFSGKLKLAGSAVAHIGFGLLLVGAVISAGTKRVASVNESGVIEVQGFEKAANPRENLMLYKNKPVQMGDYQITYMGDSLVAPNHYYKVKYKRFDKNGKVVEEFVLKPNAQANPKMGLVPSPDTRHYLLHDLYTHVTAIPLQDEADANAGEEPAMNGGSDDKNYNEPVAHEMAIGDTIHYRDGYIVLKGLNKQPKIQSITLGSNDVAVGAMLQVTTNGRTYPSEPVFMIKDNNTFDFARKVDDAGLKLRFAKIIPETHKVQIMVYQQPENKRPYIVISAIDFPYINLFWSGTLIMVIGFLMSILKRNKELVTIESKPLAKQTKEKIA
jgi:cytochrome c-type biogenesis protein CcmF